MTAPSRPVAGVDPKRLRAFLADTLLLWQIDGEVVATEPPCVAEVITADGTRIWIEPAPPGIPFRWLARWRNADAANGTGRESIPRPCSSLVGVLSAMRLALNVERGSPIRVTTQGSAP